MWSRRTTCVAEAVAGQALAGAVADVVQAGPRVVGSVGRLDEAEVAAEVDGLLGDGHRVDAVEVAGDPQRLDVGVLQRRGVERVARSRCR